MDLKFKALLWVCSIYQKSLLLIKLIPCGEKYKNELIIKNYATPTFSKGKLIYIPLNSIYCEVENLIVMSEQTSSQDEHHIFHWFFVGIVPRPGILEVVVVGLIESVGG